MPDGTDIKDVWEPGRFGWVYDLVRAHAATGDPIYGRSFHDQLAGWEAANPPFQGPHWACGQEVAVRALAILHAEDGLPLPGDDSSADDRMVRVLCWSGERIADGIGYALSQRNNHGLSEAAALIHLAVRLQGVHPDAARWLALGYARIEEQVCDQFAIDGWYAQHSFNYTRVALEQTLYAQRALIAMGGSLSAATLARIDAAVGLLVELVDASTGEVPNHGANDGARILPLSTAAYRDFRPLLTLAAIVRGFALPADLPYDADVAAWLGTEPLTRAPRRRDGVITGPSGWAVARVSECIVFLRAGSYRHRPSHLDALHIDVRAAGREIVTDPGTYSYNAPAPWNNGLVAAEVHNGPILEGEELGRRGPHFLWLSWPSARIVSAEYCGGTVRLVAERAGAVRREVYVTGDRVVVADSALRADARSMQITWLLHPAALADQPIVCAEGERLEAHLGETVGWYSPTYGLRLSSNAIRIRHRLGQGAASAVQTIILLSRAGAVHK